MSTVPLPAPRARATLPGGLRRAAQLIPDIRQGMENLLLHKLRSLLTMLGMIFGVAAVVAMLSIGAGARQQVMQLIEQLGIRNLIVEAHEATSWQEMQKVRQTSPGLTFQDFRVLRSNLSGVTEAAARKKFEPSKVLPKPQRDLPMVYGVEPSYRKIANLQITEGRYYTSEEDDHAATVCVLGQGARMNLFGDQEAVGRYVKVGDQWLRVIGIAGPQVSSRQNVEGVPSQDLNNVIYTPLRTTFFRLESSKSEWHDEIDGIYLQLASADDTVQTGEVVRSILNASHHEANDFGVIVPAELLAQQRRTQRIFDMVMVAIASISLLVGGIGIMNIMLASILERTREIGIRRALGAKQRDIVRQFLIEATLISFVGGAMGIVFGFGISRLIAVLAGWSTVMTLGSIALAFVFSVSVGLVFGIYPATKAAKLDPVEAIRYE
ncbi:MAG: ABC transporter permease [Acidobacteria bacterium]|nr:ABC transporter permease [Acidobacteriota bacterium]